jgi:hypothetical protein
MMKNNILIAALILALLSSCGSIKYLPSPDKLDINQYGSYIKVNCINLSTIDGELIAADSTNLVILTDFENKCTKIPVSEIDHFHLRYANGKHYGAIIPLFTIATLFHGFFAIITAPVNLLATIAVTTTGENAYRYNEKQISLEELKMFARFPNGIPPGINMSSIK